MVETESGRGRGERLWFTSGLFFTG